MAGRAAASLDPPRANLGRASCACRHHPEALGRAVYFMKTKIGPPDKPTAVAPLDPTIAGDGELAFGVVDSPLRSLEVMLRGLFKPMLAGQDAKLWGKASAEHQNEVVTTRAVGSRACRRGCVCVCVRNDPDSSALVHHTSERAGPSGSGVER